MSENGAASPHVPGVKRRFADPRGEFVAPLVGVLPPFPLPGHVVWVTFPLDGGGSVVVPSFLIRSVADVAGTAYLAQLGDGPEVLGFALAIKAHEAPRYILEATTYQAQSSDRR